MPILSGNIKVIFSCSHMKKDTFKMLPNKNKWCHKLCFFFCLFKSQRTLYRFLFNIESVFRKALEYEERTKFVYLQFKSGFHK